MITSFARRLTILFTTATSVILTLALCLSFFSQFKITKIQRLDSFTTQFLDLAHRLENSSGLTDSWLAQMETDGHFIIHIEDNQIPLFFSGSWETPTSRQYLLSLARRKAEEEHVNLSARPFSSSSDKTSVFSLKGRHGDTYRGSAVVISTAQGFRSMILLADTTGERRALYFQLSFFVLLEISGVLALYTISRYAVGKAVSPLEEYHQRQTDFVASAAHELRSPLAVIQASASAVSVSSEQSSHMIRLIREECARAGKLIKNLLLLASADSKSLSKDMQPVETDMLLLSLYESFEPLCLSRRIRLKLSLPEEILPKAIGNEQWIYQILSVFLDNALSYGCGSPDPVILLAAQTGKSHVTLSVSDNGFGIADEQKALIFERFYRGDASRHDKGHAGLGLSIAHTLAGQMDCTITLSDTPGGGCTFSLTLPKSAR